VDTEAADAAKEDEAAKLRALKRRQSGVQSLFELDDDGSEGLGG
jgi:hypothetical protein